MAPRLAGGRDITSAYHGEQRVDFSMRHILDLLKLAQKIILPPYGELMYDPELRALNDSVPLHLPFPVTVLEYLQPPKEGELRPLAGMAHADKIIVVARERDIGEGMSTIVITSLPHYEHDGTWGVLPEVHLPKTNYLDRAIQKGVGVNFLIPQAPFVQRGSFVGELSALLGVINALSCSNVRTEKVPVSSTRRAIKTAIPFDEYHVLTIETPGKLHAVSGNTHTGRHPREHLRRGHIRCYESGVKTWVNACVVAAGSAGKITKDYAIRRTA